MNPAAYPTFPSEYPELNQELNALAKIVNNDINKASSCDCGSESGCLRCVEELAFMKVDSSPQPWAALSSKAWLL